MKISIISDVHNNLVNLKKVLDYCVREKIETIICCGDLANKETLDFFKKNFSGIIHYVLGNMDNDQLIRVACHPELDSGSKKLDSGSEAGMTIEYKNTKIYQSFGEVEISGKKVAFIHFPDEAKKLCQSGKYDFVFYGHTHKPWTEKVEKCIMLNPGNVAGEIYPPTFAVWETNNDKFELIRVHNLT